MVDQEQAAPAPEQETPTRALDKPELFTRLKGWFAVDWPHWKEWREEAKLDYAMVAGDQWDEDAKRTLKEQNRPPSVFNIIAPMVNSVCGFEVSNRQEVRYIPRQVGASGVNEILTSAAKWFRDQSFAEDEESDAFRDNVICGLGWTESRVDFDEDPDGEPAKERIDPLEICADAFCRKPNLADRKRVWRVRKMTRDEAQAMFPDADPTTLNAGWADGDSGQVAEDTDPRTRYDRDDDNGDEASCINVTIVEVQWWEREPFYRYVDGQSGQIGEMAQGEFETLVERLGQIPPEVLAMQGIMPPQKATLQYRKVFRRAFLGTELLEVREPKIQGHFSYQVMTGYRDRNKGTWHGLVRGMRDPQTWSNKLFSQIMHILNSSAKGGILAEKDAFENVREAAAEYAKTESITWVNSGTIAGQKIMPKPGAVLPVGHFQMMELAFGIGPKVTGVNLEFLGMAQQNQAGVLEYQRRQAGVTILATLFDSLRKYRKLDGELLLRIIQEYLSDGRLVRIVGKEAQGYLPLTRDKSLGDYEVIVDDAPSSPNMKERNWEIIKSLMPFLAPAIQKEPSLAVALLPYSPLPETIAQDFAKALSKPPDPDVLAAQKAAALARINKDEASATKSLSGALKDVQEALMAGMVAGTGLPGELPPVVDGAFPLPPLPSMMPQPFGLPPGMGPGPGGPGGPPPGGPGGLLNRPGAPGGLPTGAMAPQGTMGQRPGPPPGGVTRPPGM